MAIANKFPIHYKSNNHWTNEYQLDSPIVLSPLIGQLMSEPSSESKIN